MTDYHLIVVPYELGRLRDGVGNGPERLLEAGAEDVLASSGGSVRTQLVELDPAFNQTGRGEVDACFELIRLVAERVRGAVEDGAFPVILSGSCFAGVGVVAGLAEPDPAVVWFDAHSDFNSPDTSTEGYFDGMGLAVLTGGAWQAMHARVPGARPVPESAVILAGARDFDPPEVRRLEASAVTQLQPGGAGRARGGAGRDLARADRRLPARRPGRPRHRRGQGQHLRRAGRPERRGARRSRRHGLPRVARAGALADGLRPRLRP